MKVALGTFGLSTDPRNQTPKSVLQTFIAMAMSDLEEKRIDALLSRGAR